MRLSPSKLAAFALLVSAAPSGAETFYLNETAFLGAAGALDVESFECVPLRPATNEDPIWTPSFVLSIVPLPGSTVAPMGVLMGTSLSDPHATDGLRYVQAGATSTTNGAFDLTVTFTAPVQAFSAWFTDFGDWTAGSLSVRTNLGGSFTIASNPPVIPTGTEHFVGIVSAGVPFASVTIRKTTQGDGIGMDEISFSPLPSGTSCAAVPAPEPGRITTWGRIKTEYAE